MLRARIRWWRNNAAHVDSDQLEREADALATERVEEPLGDEHLEQGASV